MQPSLPARETDRIRRPDELVRALGAGQLHRELVPYARVPRLYNILRVEPRRIAPAGELDVDLVPVGGVVVRVEEGAVGEVPVGQHLGAVPAAVTIRDPQVQPSLIVHPDVVGAVGEVVVPGADQEPAGGLGHPLAAAERELRHRHRLHRFGRGEDGPTDRRDLEERRRRAPGAFGQDGRVAAATVGGVGEASVRAVDRGDPARAGGGLDIPLVGQAVQDDHGRIAIDVVDRPGDGSGPLPEAAVRRTARYGDARELPRRANLTGPRRRAGHEDDQGEDPGRYDAGRRGGRRRGAMADAP